MSRHAGPPRAALWLLDRALAPAAAEAIAGDLIEGFQHVQQANGTAAARRWFWRQALASIASRGRAAASARVRAAAHLAAPAADQRRAGRMIGSIQDLRFGLRVLASAPGFTVTAVLTLAIGIAGATAIVTAAGWVVLRPLPYAEPDRLVHLGEPDSAGGGVGNVGFRSVRDWQTRAAAFDAIVPFRGWTPTIMGEAGAARLDGLRVGWRYFRTLGVRPALGRDFTEDDDHPDRWRVVILSHRLWQQRFQGDPSVVGRFITFFGRDYQVIGVLPATFEPLISARFYTRADVWAPLGYAPDDSSSCRTCRHLRAIGLLAPDESAATAAAELAVIHGQLRAEYPDEYGETPPVMAPLKAQLAGRFERPMGVLTAAVGFLLLVACTNVAGLLIARSAERDREIAMRSALGAGRLRLVRQLLAESLVLAVAATALGVAVARGGLILLADAAPDGLLRLDRATGDPGVWLVAAAIGALALMLFGLLPALEVARVDLQSVLRGSRLIAGRRTARIREAMIVAQVAVALVLVIGSGLMVRTVDRLLAVDPGFDPEGVLTAQFSLVGDRWAEDSAVYAFQQDLLERVRARPGVEAAGLTGLLPLGGSYDRRGFRIEGQSYSTQDEAPRAERYAVTPGYFDAMRIGLVRGRPLDERDTASSEPVMLVNEAAVRAYWPEGDARGQRVRFGTTDDSPWVRVVGVVADVRHYDLETPPIPQVYLPQSQSTDSYLVLVARAPADMDDLGAWLRREVAALAPDVPVYDVVTLERLQTAAVGTRAFLMRLLGLFAATSVLLAVIGLYGVVSQGVAGRRRELGIRVSLGARRAEVARLILARGLALVGLGVAGGLAGAALASRVLDAQLFETAALDPATYAAGAGALLLAGLAAHLMPLKRALSVNPITALRDD